MNNFEMNLILQSSTPSQPLVITCKPSGPIIDGWQRVEKVINLTNPTTYQINLEVKNTSTTATYYMDDFRVCPADGKMKSFVYDSRTLRLMAQLDENNYATFYEYDDEGTLVRTKRETERGIVTIQENRSVLRRNPRYKTTVEGSLFEAY
jgi:hypothetical protein